MFGPLLPHPRIASATSSCVKGAAAWERESQKTDSAQWLYKMAVNFRSPMYHTYSKRPKFAMLSMQTWLNSDWMYVWAAKTRIWKQIMWTDFHHERSSKRETLDSGSEEKTTLKIAINCQSKARLHSPANESYRNHLNFGAPQFPWTACMQSSFFCPLWDDVSLFIHTIVADSLQSRHLFKSILY